MHFKNLFRVTGYEFRGSYNAQERVKKSGGRFELFLPLAGALGLTLDPCPVTRDHRSQLLDFRACGWYASRVLERTFFVLQVFHESL